MVVSGGDPARDGISKGMRKITSQYIGLFFLFMIVSGLGEMR